MGIDQFGFTAIGGFGPTGMYRSNVQVFEYTGGSAYQLWNKPRGVSMAFMIALASGAGGGAGFTRASGNPGGGGGSGACSGMARFLIPAIFLPDVLYVQVGAPGAAGVPGVSSGNGGNGADSVVLISKTNALPNIVLASGAGAPGGGGGGAVGAAGTAGAVPVIAATQPISALGEWFALVGLVGVAGGAHTGANGSLVTAWAARLTSPGGGGGGIATTPNFTGGPINATALTDLGSMGNFNTQIVAGGIASAVLRNGQPGLTNWKPFFSCGGSGGATNDSGQAGHGGNGGIGSGGGGGGAGATGGNGGNGGPGLVVIISW